MLSLSRIPKELFSKDKSDIKVQVGYSMCANLNIRIFPPTDWLHGINMQSSEQQMKGWGREEKLISKKNFERMSCFLLNAYRKILSERRYAQNQTK